MSRQQAVCGRWLTGEWAKDGRARSGIIGRCWSCTIRCRRRTLWWTIGGCRWRAISPRRWRYTLNNPAFAALDQPTTGLLNPDKVKKLAGIYMLEPYQPGKIPVLMVHGLWSSPITWMEMFNDLRGDPELERNYQFWFYLYPTGQPFWRSATQLRRGIGGIAQRGRSGSPGGGAGSDGAGGAQHGRVDFAHAGGEQPR